MFKILGLETSRQVSSRDWPFPEPKTILRQNRVSCKIPFYFFQIPPPLSDVVLACSRKTETKIHLPIVFLRTNYRVGYDQRGYMGINSGEGVTYPRRTVQAINCVFGRAKVNTARLIGFTSRSIRFTRGSRNHLAGRGGLYIVSVVLIYRTGTPRSTQFSREICPTCYCPTGVRALIASTVYHRNNLGKTTSSMRPKRRRELSAQGVGKRLLPGRILPSNDAFVKFSFVALVVKFQ